MQKIILEKIYITLIHNQNYSPPHLFPPSVHFSLPPCVVLGIEPRTSCMLSKHPISKLHAKPSFFLCVCVRGLEVLGSLLV